LNRARATIRRSLSCYSYIRRHPQPFTEIEHQAAMQAQLDGLKASLEKLDQEILRIAAFGLVSRGKSALLNALLGQKLLTTGPIHGVTQWPRSLQWKIDDIPIANPDLKQNDEGEQKIVIELIDTPGLDEVEGQARSLMARNVAQQADLILFVVAGDITRTEYDALCDLRQAGKPVILVFNKIDLYPDQDREAIYQQLLSLGGSGGVSRLLSANDIVMVSAEPAPLKVRVEWPDGRVSYELETPEPQVEELKQKIFNIVQKEGRSLIALNALTQVRDAESKMAKIALAARREPAENLIQKFSQYKALAVALNPIPIIDLLGGSVADLLLIRSLARLYGLPMTSYEAGNLLKQILFSSGGLLLSELLSGVFLGLSKTGAAIGGGMGDGAGITAYAGAAIAQATMAGFGTYKVGQAAQVYLEQGCTWGQMGPSTVIQEIFSQLDHDSLCDRLREDLQQQLKKSAV
jgi:small GTP-binding protein